TDRQNNNRTTNRRRSSIYDQLPLTAEQDSMIDAIFAQSGREADRIWRQSFRPVVDSLLDNARVQVREILTPEQEQQLDSLLAERRRRRSNGNDRSSNTPGTETERQNGRTGEAAPAPRSE